MTRITQLEQAIARIDAAYDRATSEYVKTDLLLERERFQRKLFEAIMEGEDQ